MKKKILEILIEVKNGTKSPKVAQKQLLDLFDITNNEVSVIITNNEMPVIEKSCTKKFSGTSGDFCRSLECEHCFHFQ